MSSTKILTERPVSASETIGLFKPRIAVAITLSAVGGMAIAPPPLPDLWHATVLAVAVFLAAAGAGAFNQWAESDLDAGMARTAGRPFADGRLEPNGRWLAIIVAVTAIGVALAAAVNLWAAVHTLAGALTYAVVYTLWLKRRSVFNIVVGGLAGSFAVLAGAAASGSTLAAEPLLLAVVLFLWTPPHFWSLAIAAGTDYARNGVPMLPNAIGDRACASVILAHTVALALLSLLPVLWGMGAIYFAFAAVGGAAFSVTSVRLLLVPTRRRAILNFLVSLCQLLALIAGIVLDRLVLGGPA
jgi:protoheme IX farnesyltransferase